MDGGVGEVGAVTWILLVVLGALAVAGIFFLFWWFGMPYGVPRGAQRKKALRVLDERYARGEIPKPEYERKRRELEGGPSPAR